MTFADNRRWCCAVRVSPRLSWPARSSLEPLRSEIPIDRFSIESQAPRAASWQALRERPNRDLQRYETPQRHHAFSSRHFGGQAVSLRRKSGSITPRCLSRAHRHELATCPVAWPEVCASTAELRAVQTRRLLYLCGQATFGVPPIARITAAVGGLSARGWDTLDDTDPLVWAGVRWQFCGESVRLVAPGATQASLSVTLRHTLPARCSGGSKHA